MTHAIRIAMGSLIVGVAIVALCLMPAAVAPKPVPPAPVPPPTPPTYTGHEAYPFAGAPPSGHDQGVIYNSFPTTEQQGLYNKFVGFYPDYA